MKINKHWEDSVNKVESGELSGWLGWEIIEYEYIRPQVSGDPDEYYLQYFMRTQLEGKKVKRALSLGCGGGNLERALIMLDAADSIDAFDASPASVEYAKQAAIDAGLDTRIFYEVRDINVIELPANSYDFVVIKMALHHFEGIEHVYEQISRALVPGGVFMFNEFIGPSRFQWTDLQVKLMNDLLELLPPSILEAMPIKEILRPTVEQMLEMDPTEAVRSAEIIPLLERYFEIIEFKPYGGTLLHFLLHHVMPLLNLEDEKDLSILRLIFYIEETLIKHDVLSSDFAYVVSRPKN